MQLKPFLLDAWLDAYEHNIEFNLAASTGPPWTSSLTQLFKCLACLVPNTRMVGQLRFHNAPACLIGTMLIGTICSDTMDGLADRENLTNGRF